MTDFHQHQLYSRVLKELENELRDRETWIIIPFYSICDECGKYGWLRTVPACYASDCCRKHICEKCPSKPADGAKVWWGGRVKSECNHSDRD